MENITFRPATENDAEILYHVKIAAFADEFEQFKYGETDRIFKNGNGVYGKDETCEKVDS